MVAILNYSTRAVSEMSVRVVGNYRTARLWSAEADAPAPAGIGPRPDQHGDPSAAHRSIRHDRAGGLGGLMQNRLNRRQMFQSLGGAAASLAYAKSGWAAEAPTAPVAVAKCPDYGSALLPALAQMFDQLGGLGKTGQGQDRGNQA